MTVEPAEQMRIAGFYPKTDALRSSRSCVNGPQPAPWPIRMIRCALDNLAIVVKEYKMKGGNKYCI
jgi:hypothetical protein